METPLPRTQREVLRFLGMAGYCRTWIIDYALLAKPLYEATKNDQPRMVNWTDSRIRCYEGLKRALITAPTLGLPDYKKAFTLFTHAVGGFAQSVLTQTHGDRERPVAYFSKKLDAVEQGFPLCLQAVAAARYAVERTADIVMGHPVLLQVPHCVHTLLQQRNTQHLTATRLMQYETALIMAPNVTVMRCTVLNPATLLPTKEEGVPHVCTDVVQLISTVRPDLQDTPLHEADYTYYVDGSAKRAWDGSLLSGYAVCSDTETVESGRLPPTWSAQQAELYALTRACEVSEEKAVTIYTDSAYAHGVVHDKGAIWKMRGFLTSAGTLIKNGDLVQNLLHSIMLPREIAVVKCRGHQRTDDAVARGNARADEAAARAANQQIGYNMPVVTRKQGAKATAQTDVPTSAPTEFDVIQLQAAASNVEHQDWIKLGAQRPAEGQMWTINDKPVAPRAILPWLARMAHQNGHVCHRGVMRQVTSTWAAPGLSAVVTMVCRSCAICQRHNRGAPPRRRHNVGHPAPVGPFCHIQFDFFNLPPCMSFKHVLVVVDMFTKWVEAYPCVRADAITVAKCLLRHFICRFGVPQKVSSDQGGHFTGDVIKAVLKALGVIQSFHCVYCPQSAGLVERTNGTLKAYMNAFARPCRSQQASLSTPSRQEITCW
uniref:protein NYNRIN-like n=2 Tax=Myxine glutinosa TaxID=7769 RepID=UPI00358EBF0B